MKNGFLFTVLIVFPIIVFSQDIITTSGGNITNNSVQVNWTIGEPITDLITNNKTIVTSGLNQPTFKIETSIENINTKIDVSVFPNPTSQFINIKFDGESSLRARILTLSGAVISAYEIKEKLTQLDLSKVVSGVFIIELSDNTGKLNTYRIIKQ